MTKKTSPDDERRPATDLTPTEKQKVTKAATQGENLKPGPHGDLNPPEKDPGLTGPGGMSDSQHQ